MNHPYSTFLGGSSYSPPALAALASILVAVVIDVRVIFYCLDDLNRHKLVAGGNKSFWAAVIILGGPVGQIFYWLYGRGPY